jgi:hypothetical protein
MSGLVTILGALFDETHDDSRERFWDMARTGCRTFGLNGNVKVDKIQWIRGSAYWSSASQSVKDTA